MPEAEFTPALGHSALTHLYGAAIRLLTRERRWREALVEQISPKAGESILDVGCGTGSLAVMLKRQAPQARVVGLDPDPAILATAADKANRAEVDIEWRRGFARDAAGLGEFDQAVSTLVFHQVPPAEKPGGHSRHVLRRPPWGLRAYRRLLPSARLADAPAIPDHPGAGREAEHPVECRRRGREESGQVERGANAARKDHSYADRAISLFRVRKDGGQ